MKMGKIELTNTENYTLQCSVHLHTVYAYTLLRLLWAALRQMDIFSREGHARLAMALLHIILVLQVAYCIH